MTKKTSRIITLVVDLLILIIFAVFMCDFFGIFGNTKDVKIVINGGDSVTSVSKKMQKEGIVLNGFMFKTFFMLSEPEYMLTPGEFTVNAKMPYSELVDKVIKATVTTNNVTIPEGYTNNEIAKKLKDNEIISDEEEFKQALKEFSFELDGTTIDGSKNDLNGYLFPDTYNFHEHSASKDVIDRMVSNFKNHWRTGYSQRASELGMSVEEVVILASIIQREARFAEDFYAISSVFHNRIKIGMKLQSCATVQFILNERKPVLSIADTKIDSPYNTYLNEGLTPTAISSPGALAIEAALFPDDSEYLFFFCDKDGNTHYSKTLEEHNRLMQKYPLQ